MRRENLNGAYNLDTNDMHFPRSTQPTHARWTQVQYPLQEPPHTGFPTPSEFQRRNYMTVDYVMRQPPASNLGIPGPESSEYDIGPKGLSDVTDEVIACLPPECLQSFLEACEQEKEWKASFGNEIKDGARANVKVTYSQ